MGFRGILDKVPRQVWYILAFFFCTRLILTIVGVVSRVILEPYHGKRYLWVYSDHLWLDIWGMIDSGKYLDISLNGYPSTLGPDKVSVWGYFPLYPLLMNLCGRIIGDNYVAGIVVSNLCLVLAAVYFYRIARLDSDNSTALRVIKYLFIFPASFVLSGVFTESLFLLLLVMSFYYAKTGKWWKAGISGFFLSQTRIWGVFVILPLFYEYFRQKGFCIRKIERNVLWLFLVPLGLLLFMSYSYWLTGDFFAYFTVQKNALGHTFTNPFSTLAEGLSMNNVVIVFCTSLTIAALLLLVVFCKKTDLSYLFFSLFLIIAPLMAKPNPTALPRYVVVAFAMYLVLGKISKNNSVDHLLTAVSGVLQGFMMVLFANGFKII